MFVDQDLLPLALQDHGEAVEAFEPAQELAPRDQFDAIVCPSLRLWKRYPS